MGLRRLFLQVMLWSLGIAALFGVLGVLLAGREFMWRVTGTAIITAIATGALMPISMLIDRERWRSAGMLGMALVVAEYVIGLALLWDVERVVHVLEPEELALTMFFAALMGVPAMFCLRLRRVPTFAVAALAGLAYTLIGFALFMVATWLPGDIYAWSRPFWETSSAVAFLAPLIVLNLVGLRSPARRWWRWIGAAAASAALAIALVAIWQGLEEGSGVFTTLVCTAAAVAHAGLVILCPLSSRQEWLRWATMAAGIATGVLVSAWALELLPALEELLTRLIAASAIAAGCGSLALLVLARLNRRVDFEPSSGGIVSMTIHCPRCGRKQAIAIGDASCCACHLRIHTRIEEPTCPTCGYALYRLQSNQCPECGTRIDRRA